MYIDCILTFMEFGKRLNRNRDSLVFFSSLPVVVVHFEWKSHTELYVYEKELDCHEVIAS